MKKSPFCTCTIKQLPQKKLLMAANFACSANPVNAALNPSGPEAIAVLTSKYWGPAGVHLTVGFVSPAAAALQDKIVSYMNKWSQYCNASFTIIQGAARNANVRISLGGGGYWSYLGTDISHVSPMQQTMNLQGFSLSTPDSEFNRVVTHETGHTLGCPHEHMRAAIINRLDYAKTVAEFERTQGWTEQEIVAQIFTPLSEQSIRGTPQAEEDSVMCYMFPGTVTKDGRPIVGGSKITADDGVFMGTIYPNAITPPPPSGDTLTVNIGVAGYGLGQAILKKV